MEHNDYLRTIRFVSPITRFISKSLSLYLRAALDKIDQEMAETERPDEIEPPF